ncbi:MORN repeat-containing protein [Desulfopila sp. IMCC35008]|uniref:MORN repeat-containing protein n=1 Tax=Desulfopila sp. IMCC35008 TaxID=2653858 RepID=UPI0013D269B8|nr:hypothetical protein [Desulfopila sp. IMCC35008]
MKSIFLIVIVCFLATHECYAGSSRGKCVSGDCQGGYGTVNFEDGSIYVGQFNDTALHGQGAITYSDGMKYVGQYKNGIWHGQGTLTKPNGMKYVGQYKNGKWHGQATLTMPNGDEYVGEYVDGVSNGTVKFLRRVDGAIFTQEYDMGELLSSIEVTQGEQVKQSQASQSSKKNNLQSPSSPLKRRWKKAD